MRILALFLLFGLFACERAEIAPVEYPQGIYDNLLAYDTVNLDPSKIYGLCMQQNEPGKVIVNIYRDDLIKINWWSFAIETQTGWQFDGGTFFMYFVGYSDVIIRFYEAMPGHIEVWRDGQIIKTVILR